MRTILVTAAVEIELSFLVRELDAEMRRHEGIPPFHEWCSPNLKVLLALTGMGKVNAAMTSTALVRAFHPDILINTGCAGAYAASGLSVGDIAAASSETYGDEGVLTPSGWQPLESIGIPLAEVDGRRYFNEIPLSPSMTMKARTVADTLGISLRTGKFVTVSTCSGTADRGAELSGRFDALCESMEGAAVAHVALIHGLDCLEVRGISNMVEDRDLSRWNIAEAAAKAQQFILPFIETM